MYVLRVLFCFVCLFVFCCCFFRVAVFSFAKRPDHHDFDVAIYLFIYFLHFISVLLLPSPILKTIQKMGERNEKKTLQQQTNNYHTSNVI